MTYKIIICPHTNEEVVALFDKGNRDGYPDYLCLHNEEDLEKDREDVEHFRKTGKILHNELFKSIYDSSTNSNN